MEDIFSWKMMIFFQRLHFDGRQLLKKMIANDSRHLMEDSFQWKMTFEMCVKCLQTLFKESFEVFSRKFRMILKQVSQVFQEDFKEVLRLFHGSFNGVSRKFQEHFKIVLSGI